MKVTLTIESFTQSLGDIEPLHDECGYRVIRGDPSPPIMEIQAVVEDRGSTYTHRFDVNLSCPQFNQLEKELSYAVKMFREQQREERSRTPKPNYRGHKVKRVVSYDSHDGNAVLEIEDLEGQWCVLFNTLDLWTQGFILDKWRQRTTTILERNDDG